jgi:hypothetical protein
MCPAINDHQILTSVAATNAPANDTNVAQQPCSGTLIIQSAAFGSGANAASPEFVCLVKQAS